MTICLISETAKTCCCVGGKVSSRNLPSREMIEISKCELGRSMQSVSGL